MPQSLWGAVQRAIPMGLIYGAGFQPLMIFVNILPGALPQAGMKRAFGASSLWKMPDRPLPKCANSRARAHARGCYLRARPAGARKCPTRRGGPTSPSAGTQNHRAFNPDKRFGMDNHLFHDRMTSRVPYRRNSESRNLSEANLSWTSDNPAAVFFLQSP